MNTPRILIQPAINGWTVIVNPNSYQMTPSAKDTYLCLTVEDLLETVRRLMEVK